MRVTVVIILLLIVIGVVAYFLYRPTSTHETGQDQIVYTFDGEQDDQGTPSPWQLHVSTGKAQISIQHHPEMPQDRVLWVKAEKASYFLARTDREFNLEEYPHLAWSWKAIILPRDGDVRKSSLVPFAENKNDQALQLLVRFDNERVISYMWDSTAPVGTEVKEQNPFANIMAVVVESGEEHLESWRSYQRNLADDYRRLYSGTALTVKAIAVQTNANHTRSQGEGYFGPIVFTKSK
jgi:hypothetical protein